MTCAPTGHNVRANGIRQHYLRYRGPGAPMVVVPGITSPAITWGFVAERLAEAFDVYVLDVRGRGLSSTGPDLDYGTDALAADLAGFIEAAGLRDVTVLGHSMGARIGARALGGEASGIARLVMVDPPVSGPGRRPYPSRLPWYVESIRLATAGTDAEGMRAFCPTWSDEQRALRAEWLHTCYEPAIVRAFNDFHDDDFHADLPKLGAHAGLMIAGRGGVIEQADRDEIARLNPSIAMTRVENAGHMIPWDDLEGFLSGIDALLGTRISGRS
ncbi:MAG: alpha/beta hydrolase [Rhizobiaceae bacterium]|nr:alpha/beta hydrolase [Rhizobiaceae bacterium]